MVLNQTPYITLEMKLIPQNPFLSRVMILNFQVAHEKPYQEEPLHRYEIILTDTSSNNII